MTTPTPLSITLDLSFNLDNEAEKQTMSWLQQAPQSDIKNVIIIGHTCINQGIDHLVNSKLEQQTRTSMNTKDSTLNAYKLQYEAELALMKQSYQTQYSILKQENEMLKTSLNNNAHTLKTTYDEQAKKLLEAADYKIATLERLITEKTRRVIELEESIIQENNKINDILLNKMHSDEVKKLQDELKERDMTIASLKNTNYCKGIQGETMIRDILMEAFSDYQIEDKSGYAAESDLHMINKHDEFIAIESKYKSIITPQDVDKSIRDLQYLKDKYGQRFVGYIFYSLNTTNIPRKGISFEVIEDIPIMWYGTNIKSDTFRPQEIVNIAKVIITLSQSLKVRNVSMNDTVELCNEMLDQITSNKKVTEQVYDTIHTMEDQVKKLQTTNNTLYDKLMTYMTKQGISISVSTSKQGTKRQQVQHTGSYECVKCGKTYTRQSDLTKHNKIC